MNREVENLDEALLELAWSLWSGLGVSSWHERQVPFVVEVEPLLAYTAFVAREDTRLLREVTSWVAEQMPLLSVRQFKHTVTSQRWPFVGPIEEFGEKLARATGRGWPGKSDGHGESTRLSERPSIADLGAPCTLQLRTRATFGVSSRAEIVRVLLLTERPLAISELAERIAYTRRQVSADTDLLVRAGVLKPSSSAGPTRVLLHRRDALIELLGPIAKDFDWAPMFRLLTGLQSAVRELETGRWNAPEVEATRRLRQLRPQLDRLDMVVGSDHGDPRRSIAEVAHHAIERIFAA